MAGSALLVAGSRLLVPPPAGTLLVMASAGSAQRWLMPELEVHSAGGWKHVSGRLEVAVPAAPSTATVGQISVPAGAYDALRLNSRDYPARIEVPSGMGTPVLVAISAGEVAGVYGGNEAAGMALAELAGQVQALPDFELVDQRGRPLTRASVSGSDVILAAFHTTCHETCPLYTGLFADLRKQLPASTVLVEVTTDPDHDTPEVLSDYAQRAGISWTLATGERAAVEAFWKPLGGELGTGDSHRSLLVIADRRGFVRSTYQGIPDLAGRLPVELRAQLNDAGARALASHSSRWGSSQILATMATMAGLDGGSSAAGEPAPGFDLRSADGRRVSLDQFRGRPLILNFWASWCSPCRREMPVLERVQLDHPGLAVVLINEREQPAAASRYLRDLKIDLAQAGDRDGQVAGRYHVLGLPTTVFIRPDGTVAGRRDGELDSHLVDLELPILEGRVDLRK